MNKLDLPKIGELFENKDGVKFVYVGTKALPIFHNKKNLSFLLRKDFQYRDNQWHVTFNVSNQHAFLMIPVQDGVQFMYTSAECFRFLNLSKLIKLKKSFNSLKLGTFEDVNRNLPGINNLDVAYTNFRNFNIYGFPEMSLGTKKVLVPLKNLVFEPIIENNSCGPCGKFYPITQQLFNFLQMYEDLASVKSIDGYFVNKFANLVSFKIIQTKKFHFEFNFKDSHSNKSLLIEANSLFELKDWYKAIPESRSDINFICNAGCICPSGGFSWGLLDVLVVKK